jgi:hypothetical protein
MWPFDIVKKRREAKAKQCCAGLRDFGANMIHCSASNCMAWRWTGDHWTESNSHTDDMRLQSLGYRLARVSGNTKHYARQEADGYCGLAGASK